MPARAPLSGPKLKKLLRRLGLQIRLRRKVLKVSAVAAAEAAGISRMTLHRIERGEASVTIGAYLGVISVLGLAVELADANLKRGARHHNDLKIPDKIRPADFPQLKRLAWQLDDTTELTPQEALDLYERNWRHVDLKKMDAEERELIQGLMAALGRGRLFV
jgi:transcriptional regulator with XRE-family HTH domain